MRTFRLSFVVIFSAIFFTVNAADMPRPEYPRPQFERSEWTNLNGTWTYIFDFGNSGAEQGYEKSTGFSSKIIVPFCPESSLSGVGHKDFINAMWYQRTLHIPQSWTGKHVMLNFGGVDYRSTIYINGRRVQEHFGGSASFAVDIAPYVNFGVDNNLVVHVQDDVRSRVQGAGKQSDRLHSYSCFYTRVTGIWQTVWLEPIAKGGLKACRITPDLDNKQFVFEPSYYEIEPGYKLEVKVKEGAKTVFRQEVTAANSSIVAAKMSKVKTWSPESPFLYDIELTVKNERGAVVDYVKAYAGMRKVEIRNREFYLNNAPYYLRLVLDQGYYPDGQWTAPTDEQLKRDIVLSQQAGFNGARLHQKVFEQRYLYWADKLGYLTWGEYASWGMDWTNPVAARNMLSEWDECLHRDYNAPCIIAWSPLNESWKEDIDEQRARLTNDLYFMTKRIDPTRPVSAASGGMHAGFTDIFSEHTYEQDRLKLYQQLALDKDGSPYILQKRASAPYKGECYMLDEFGGITWVKKTNASEISASDEFWGYGNGPKTLEEFYTRLEGQVSAVLATDHIAGFCFTQITDVEQEKNGIYTYDRQTKFDMNRIRQIITKSRAKARSEFK